MASQQTFDYVIVGGGTSGLVVANRLSENPETSIVILEAGADMSDDPRVNIPALWTTLMSSDAVWHYQSTPQPGMGGRSIREPQGKVLGGSTAVNGQTYVAPSAADFDSWASLGNPGWGWDSMGHYVRKPFSLQLPVDQETSDHLGLEWLKKDLHGSNGPLKISFPGSKENPLIKAWVDAFRGMNKTISDDPFSGVAVGGYSNGATVDQDTKTRSYAASAYGAPLKARPNVRVITGILAQKILFDKSDAGLNATGVEAVLDGQVQTFHASKEVILAAGVFNTPKLLEISGIGQSEILKQHNIKQLLEIPGVGENLQDHLMTGVSYEVNEGIVTGDPLMRQEPSALEAAQKLYAEQKGPLCFGGTQSNALMPIDYDLAEILDNTPVKSEDKEFIETVRAIHERPNEATATWFMFLAQANLHEGAKSFVGDTLLPQNFASLGCFLSHPFSRGNSHITSTDAAAMPKIDPKFFSHPADLEVFARHLMAIEELRHTKELSAYLKPDGKRNHPDSHHIGTLEGAKRYILDTATTTYHSCGTAVMLPKEKGGVVDTKLKVYGTTNLRIVDASIFPTVPRGNNMSAVYAVAEKAADIIKGQ
ncbi:unnamed protein product [Clonostachys rhizophaga]|uniref:Glucose-methanol-choline oxidoreductase N-terminal domain-containing protein n=1 Tax=Clonostachys rhizophaga TaxID=160324 RepID=A0A9N9YQC8_9HYPO|nr:unnamed protein product [Clonostachys rhizophaga]